MAKTTLPGQRNDVRKFEQIPRAYRWIIELIMSALL